MRRWFILAAAAVLAAVATAASVEPAEAKPKWKGGHHGKVRGGPPPWAPAYGYRRKRAVYGYGRPARYGYRAYRRPRIHFRW